MNSVITNKESLISNDMTHSDKNKNPEWQKERKENSMSSTLHFFSNKYRHQSALRSNAVRPGESVNVSICYTLIKNEL